MSTLVIPESIMIEGERWRVCLENTAPKRFRKRKPLLSRGIYGETHYHDKLILIADGLTQDQQAETFVHELLHATYHAINDQELGAALEERIVEGLDGPLYRVLLQLEIIK